MTTTTMRFGWNGESDGRAAIRRTALTEMRVNRSLRRRGLPAVSLEESASVNVIHAVDYPDLRALRITVEEMMTVGDDSGDGRPVTVREAEENISTLLA